MTTSLHPLGNTKLRTPETFEKYHDNPKRHSADCFICEAEPLMMVRTRYWKLLANDFPYDAVAAIHLMMAPVRHVGACDKLSPNEKKDLERIKRRLDREGVFDAVIENLTRGRTYPRHYHLHVIQWKRT